MTLTKKDVDSLHWQLTNFLLDFNNKEKWQLTLTVGYQNDSLIDWDSKKKKTLANVKNRQIFMSWKNNSR